MFECCEPPIFPELELPEFKPLGHCGHLLMFAKEDMPDRKIRKGEPYCLKCPGISLMNEHCCISEKCADQLLKHKEELKRIWNENYTDNKIEVPAETLRLSFPPRAKDQVVKN